MQSICRRPHTRPCTLNRTVNPACVARARLSVMLQVRRSEQKSAYHIIKRRADVLFELGWMHFSSRCDENALFRRSCDTLKVMPQLRHLHVSVGPGSTSSMSGGSPCTPRDGRCMNCNVQNDALVTFVRLWDFHGTFMKIWDFHGTLGLS